MKRITFVVLAEGRGTYPKEKLDESLVSRIIVDDFTINHGRSVILTLQYQEAPASSDAEGIYLEKDGKKIIQVFNSHRENTFWFEVEIPQN